VKTPLLLKFYRITANCFALFGLLVALVTATPLVSWISDWLARPWTAPHGDVLVVLSGSALPDGTIGLSSYWRCIYAARVFREGGFQRVFITGGSVSGETPISVSMQRLMIDLGVPADSISVETSSISTHENGIHSVPMLLRMPGKKVLLTSDYHMFRSRRVFRNAGLDLPGWPFPDAGKRAAHWDGRWPAFLEVSLELLKIVDYKIHGWI
jgi:uncharacterized SAM-binding protein YcdF (DUF218 family)